MKTLKRIALVSLLLILLIALSAFTLLRRLNHRSLPDYTASVELAGLHAPVEVFRDSFAIPHVYATDEHDLYLATGYLVAQDRLWQMDLLRRVTEGRLSEIFGAGYVDTDHLLRSLRFTAKSEAILEKAHQTDLIALEAFAEGVNSYIRSHEKKLPPEFGILGYKPELWKPVHSLNMIGYMAWDLKAGWSEYILEEIRKNADSIRYSALLPNLSLPSREVFPDSASQFGNAGLSGLLVNQAILKALRTDVLDASNNWAVSGHKTLSGKPLLANDMHLSLSVPGIWYQMHQCVPGKLNVTGVMLPTTPYIICGHNDSIAWGMTNTYVDNLDFYEERINPADSGQYEYMGRWENFTVEKTLISVKGGEQKERNLVFSRHGAVISIFKQIPDKVVSMHWVGDEMSDELRTVGLLNRASNWVQFLDAFRTFRSISQNVAYADTRGNIGLFCAAGIPMRKRDKVFAVLPGWSDAFEWTGMVPFESLPFQFNPARGFVASANNRTAPSDYPHHIGTWYAPPSRFERIAELLAGSDDLDIPDFCHMQLDETSVLARRYVPVFLAALALNDWEGAESEAIELLKSWNHKMDAGYAAPAIFESMYLNLMRCTFADEMGEELFGKFNGISSISEVAMDAMLSNAGHPWFDDVTTSEIAEKLSDAIRCSFTRSVADLSARLGPDPSAWKWGDIHPLQIDHPLGSVKAIDRLFKLNRGPFASGGSFHTVAAKSYDWNKPFVVDHGSSQRHIYDPGNWDRSLSVIPTGICGIPASEHYCDQTGLYSAGMYHGDWFSKSAVRAHARYISSFTPEKR